MDMPTERRAIKPDAAAFDEIRIVCVPRYKESELSGSEWRVSYHTEFYRNGNLVFRNDVHTSLDFAVHLLSHTYLNAIDNGFAMYAGEGDFCDQEGCKNKATVKLVQTKEGCGRCGNVKEPEFQTPYRLFCDRHKVRGDSSIDDADCNYQPPQA